MKDFIRVTGVSHSFAHQKVLDSVSMELSQGKIHGFVGNNGSGKTLLFKVICGYLRPKEGHVFVRGKEVGRAFDFPPDMGLMLETPGFIPYASAYQNLLTLWSLRGKPNERRIHETLRVVGLDSVGKKPVGKFSLGMRQRLGIAQALMENPSLLILDEPFNGLDKQGVNDIHELLFGMKDKGITILLSSHIPTDIDLLCDTVHMMEAGQLQPIRTLQTHT